MPRNDFDELDDYYSTGTERRITVALAWAGSIMIIVGYLTFAVIDRATYDADLEAAELAERQ